MTERTRTITWEDPVESSGDAAGQSGLEYLSKIRDGEIPPPPIARLMGFELAELEEGRAVLAVEPAEYHSGGSAPYGRFAAHPRVTG